MKSLLLKIIKFAWLMVLISYESSLYAHIKNNYSIEYKLKDLESSTKGRLGIFAVNTESGDVIEYRSNEIFPTGCTSKVMGVAAILKKSMSTPGLLSTKINYSKEDLQEWSPITKKHVFAGMTIQDLCAAAISLSDNTAMNLLLKPIGGIQGINDFARSIADPSFRQDSDWPLEAYSGGASNLKDSSTPKAMVASLHKLTLGNALARPQRDLLTTWLIDSKTGTARIRSSIPKGWIIGNKTGTGAAYGSTNDLAIIWPLEHEPILIGIYYTANNQNAIKREDVVATATKLIIAEFIQQDQKLKY